LLVSNLSRTSSKALRRAYAGSPVEGMLHGAYGEQHQPDHRRQSHHHRPVGQRVVNKVGWHTGGEVDLPEGIDLEFLPESSPVLMPAERLWPLTNEALANGLLPSPTCLHVGRFDHRKTGPQT
jgi:hypothetical protein